MTTPNRTLTIVAWLLGEVTLIVAAVALYRRAWWVAGLSLLGFAAAVWLWRVARRRVDPAAGVTP